MSSSTFWASKASALKTAASPPASTKPLTTAATKPTTKKNGLVLKPMTNGANGSTSSAANGKKISWADSEDDDEFLASFGVNKDDTATALKTSVLEKEARITELESHVGTTTLRIEQLDASVAEKEDRISELKATVQDIQTRVSELQYIMTEKDARITALEKDGNAKALNVQELIAQVDEKDCRIAVLEKELVSRGPIIRGLATPSESPSETSTNIEVETSEPESTVESKKAASGSLEDPEAPTQSNVPEPVAVKVPEHSPKKAAEEVSDSKTTGPAFGNADFPIFVTRETLKVVPLAPAPKKLTFPIDFNKYNKKSTQSIPSKEVQSYKHGKAGTTRSWGLASKAVRDPNATPPELNPLLDIRHMTHAQRALYANGPEVSILMGSVELGIIPKFMLMQCSAIAHKHFTLNPTATSFVLAADSMDAEAAKLHIQWMDEMTYQGRVYSLTLEASQMYDIKNLQLCQAARVLGLNNSYVGHFTKQFCDRIRYCTLSLELADLICTLAYPDNDPIFDCLANQLAAQRARRVGTSGDLNTQAVATLEAKHAVLARKMAMIAQRWDGAGKKGGVRTKQH